jgi:hypothetical protein
MARGFIGGLAAAGLLDFQPSALPPAFASWHDGAVWLSFLLWIHALPFKFSLQNRERTSVVKAA